MLYKNISGKNMLFYTTNGTKAVIAPGETGDGDKIPDLKTHKGFREVNKSDEIAPVEQHLSSEQLATPSAALSASVTKLKTQTKADIANLEEKFAVLSQAFDKVLAELEALKKTDKTTRSKE